MTDPSGSRFIPIVAEDFYKVILAPVTQYGTTRRSTVFPTRGISYVYGISQREVAGPQTEVIEVWFDRSRWTASTVRQWMEKHGDSLPRPGIVKDAPAGRPALAGGSRP